MTMKDLRSRIENLTPLQQRMLAVQLRSLPERRLGRGTSSPGSSLIAYVQGDGPIDIKALTGFLKVKLPDYMIPAAIVQLEEFPRLPNGKINLRALPRPGAGGHSASPEAALPSTETERTLAAIWEEVLHFAPVGIHDNFFEIGGDSILSIQIIAKARKAGLQLAPDQLFEHQTIAELALFVQAESSPALPVDIFQGPVPLLPIQYWFFEEHQIAPHFWNQGMVLRFSGPAPAERIEKALEQLIRRHEALRLSFHSTGDQWQARILAPEEINAFQYIDLSDLPEAEQEKRIADQLAELQGNRNLSGGSLFQGLYFECQPARENRLLVVAHHLVVDYVSWQIILDDLKTLLGPAQLPAATDAYRQWCGHLLAMAQSKALEEQLEYWKAQCSVNTSLPLDFERALPVSEQNSRSVGLTLSADETNLLVHQVPGAYNTRLEEVVVAALVWSIGQWADQKKINIGMERHGREANDLQLDLSGTVGWLTSYFPLSFDLQEGEAALLVSVKERLRKVPQGGVGYGLLRYLHESPQIREALAFKPAVIFNYLGKQAVPDPELPVRASFLQEGLRAPQSERYHLLEMNAMIVQDRLQMVCTYNLDFHREATIESLLSVFAEKLRRLIQHCAASQQGNYTPSDFPEVDLKQDDLDRLLDQLNF